MKRILFITALMVFVLTEVAKAQSHWDHPWPGATHHYTANVTDPELDNPVRWWVATDATGITKAAYSTDYTFVTAGYNLSNDRLEGTAVYDVQIQWGNGVANNADYYIVLEVDDKTSGCTNRMTLHIQIVSTFDELAWDVTHSSIPGTVVVNGGLGDDTEDPTCPTPVVNPLWDGTGPTDIGNSEIVFRVNRQGSILGWQFEFRITEVTNQPFTIDNIQFVDDLNHVLPVSNPTVDLTGGSVNVASNKDWVLAKVQIRNQMGVTLHLNFDLITTNDLTKDAGGKLDVILTDNRADHTIKPIPVITGFGGN